MADFIRFPCPSCKRPLQFIAGRAGRPFRCPGCGTTGTVPTPPSKRRKHALPAQSGWLSFAGWGVFRFGLVLVLLATGALAGAVLLLDLLVGCRLFGSDALAQEPQVLGLVL